MNVENHGMFSCREHRNGELGVNMSFCTEVDWVMHGSITKWPLTLSLSSFKKMPLLFVEAFTAFLLSGDIVGIASGSSMAIWAIPSWPWRPRSKHVCSKCALHKNECSNGHFVLVSFTLVVQIRLYFRSDGNRCRLTLSLVMLPQPAATHLGGIIENNKLQTWQKTLGNFFSSNTLHALVRCMYRAHTWAGKCCGSQIGNRLSLRHEFYVNGGVWACWSAPPKF